MAGVELIGLFPTPFVRVPAALDADLVEGLLRRFSTRASVPNSASAELGHTQLLSPGDSPLLAEVVRQVLPSVVEFGAVMFGERMPWSVKEMWVNVMAPGGHQAVHNHANSFISGIVYLTPIDSATRTVFVKSLGDSGFVFRNDHVDSRHGPYSAEKWVSPQPEPGDLVLFPSYLLHEVPKNPGPNRLTLPFNAIPARLDAWGYRISFAG